MREIKFRAWHQEHGMTMTPVLSTSSYTGKVICTGYDKNLHEITLPLMQYTGLKDKNGVDIYDGDIIMCYPDDIEALYTKVVEWDNESPSLGITTNGRSGATLCKGNQDILLVIGNIHENPDLLN